MYQFKTEHFGLLFVISLALVLRFAAVSFLDIEPTSDAASYMEMATTMLNSGHMDDGLGNVAYFSAGYPLFLVPFLRFLGRAPRQPSW